MNGEDLHGTCFTNRNIRLGEKIYIRVIETHPKLSGSMDFGLTNYDPAKIGRSPADHFHKLRKDKGSKLLEYAPDFNDVFCFTLSGDSLSLCLSMMLFTKQSMLKPCQLEDMYGSLLTCSEK